MILIIEYGHSKIGCYYDPIFPFISERAIKGFAIYLLKKHGYHSEFISENIQYLNTQWAKPHNMTNVDYYVYKEDVNFWKKYYDKNYSPYHSRKNISNSPKLLKFL